MGPVWNIKAFLMLLGISKLCAEFHYLNPRLLLVGSNVIDPRVCMGALWIRIMSTLDTPFRFVQRLGTCITSGAAVITFAAAAFKPEDKPILWISCSFNDHSTVRQTHLARCCED